MKRLVIDDLRVFDFEATYARNVEEAHKILTQDSEWDEVYLDHDLGATGDVREIVSIIEAGAHAGTLLPIHKFIIVTSNPVGFSWIKAALEPFYTVEDGRNIPFRIEYT